MSKIRVSFNSDTSALAFANKWKLEAPTASTVDVDWHLLPQAIKEGTAIGHELLDVAEHEFIVKGEQAAIEAHATVVQDLGGGFFLVKSTKAIDLGKAVESIDHNQGTMTFLGVSSINGMNSVATETDPTSAEGQWARIRVASTYRPLVSSYSLHETNAVSKPEVYIMDTGVWLGHPEFDSPDLEKDYFYIVEPLRGSIYSENDNTGHGTGVASMALGKNLGITSYAKMRVIKIAGLLSDGTTMYSANLFEVAQALDAILDEVAADPNKTRILNCSWGVSRSSFLDAKFQALIDAGVTVVAAAGNSGISVEDVTPAGIDACLTVGASDKYDIPCGFNNISPNDNGLVTAGGLSLDLFAPGEEVMHACTEYSENLYSLGDGTSYSAPLCAGVCAVIGSFNENAVLANRMKEEIMTTVTKNALLFEDDTFSENQNNLLHVITADPSAEYKNSDMVSYLGVSIDEDLVIDINSNIDLSHFKTLYPDDTITFSIKFIDPAIEAKYSEYIICDSISGEVTIKPAEGVTLPDDVKLEAVEFVAIATTPKVKIETNTIFYFNNNPLHADTLNADVTLALTDVNSISFFAYWSVNLK